MTAHTPYERIGDHLFTYTTDDRGRNVNLISIHIRNDNALATPEQVEHAVRQSALAPRMEEALRAIVGMFDDVPIDVIEVNVAREVLAELDRTTT